LRGEHEVELVRRRNFPWPHVAPHGATHVNVFAVLAIPTLTAVEVQSAEGVAVNYELGVSAL